MIKQTDGQQISQTHAQTQTQTQTQKLTPVQQTSLLLLTAPAYELETLLRMKYETNPVMKIVEPDYNEPEFKGENQTELNEKYDDDEYGKVYEEAVYDIDRSDRKNINENSDESEKKHDYLIESVASCSSPLMQLLEQLDSKECSPEIREIAETVIFSISKNGRLERHPADIATECQCSMETVEEAIRLVQSFSPCGIAARNWKECLLLQLSPSDPDYGLLKKMLEDFSGKMEKRQFNEIAEEMKISHGDVMRLIEKLKTLDFFPGREDDRTEYVIPEAEIVPAGDEFIVIMNDDIIPKLKYENHYVKKLKEPDVDKPTKRYIEKAMKEIDVISDSLDMRKTTIRSIANIIASEQRKFLEDGKLESLEPMTLNHVANMLGFNVSTVSRAIAEKYIKTPNGIFAFKDLFPRVAYRSGSGDSISPETVKGKIQSMINSEEKKHPLSDGAISEKLKLEGIDVSRRTVAEYRSEMNIPSSFDRRKK